MEYHINTKCVQAGYEPKNGESRVLPIIQSTTFKYDNAATLGKLFDLEENGFFYTRLANPTLSAVADKIAALEGGVGAMLTASGHAASMLSITSGVTLMPSSTSTDTVVSLTALPSQRIASKATTASRT